MIGGVTRHMLPHLSGVPHLQVRDGPLENLWGVGGRAKYKKNIRAREN